MTKSDTVRLLKIFELLHVHINALIKNKKRMLGEEICAMELIAMK